MGQRGRRIASIATGRTPATKTRLVHRAFREIVSKTKTAQTQTDAWLAKRRAPVDLTKTLARTNIGKKRKNNSTFVPNTPNQRNLELTLVKLFSKLTRYAKKN